jgi:hypothetical protein
MTTGNSGLSALVLLSGLPGSGKTTFARHLATWVDALHLESDAIRFEFAGTPAYTASENAHVFATLERRAAAALEAGRHAIVDATNLTQRDRKRFLRLATRQEAVLVAVRVIAPDAVIRERLARPRDGYSQATIAIYERMAGRPQAFAIPAVVVDTSFPLGPSLELVARLLRV